MRYVHGDATSPEGKGNRIIMHICNSVGAWGAGFVLAVSKRWPHVRNSYMDWHNDRHNNDFELGAVQFVEAQPSILVANMIAQKGIHTTSSGPPIRYEALSLCLKKVALKAKEINASVHAPKIGAGLAGGDFKIIEALIDSDLCSAGVDVTIYEFSG